MSCFSKKNIKAAAVEIEQISLDIIQDLFSRSIDKALQKSAENTSDQIVTAINSIRKSEEPKKSQPDQFVSFLMEQRGFNEMLLSRLDFLENALSGKADKV